MSENDSPSKRLEQWQKKYANSIAAKYKVELLEIAQALNQQLKEMMDRYYKVRGQRNDNASKYRDAQKSIASRDAFIIHFLAIAYNRLPKWLSKEFDKRYADLKAESGNEGEKHDL